MGSQAYRGGFALRNTGINKTVSRPIIAPEVAPMVSAPTPLPELDKRPFLTYPPIPIFAPIKPGFSVDPVTGNRVVTEKVIPQQREIPVEETKSTSAASTPLTQAFAPVSSVSSGEMSTSVAPANLSAPSPQTGSVNAVVKKPTNWLLIGGIGLGALVLGFITVKLIRR